MEGDEYVEWTRCEILNVVGGSGVQQAHKHIDIRVQTHWHANNEWTPEAHTLVCFTPKLA
jgi:hypothetical protein